ncbi:MAG: hypothetical protein U1D30_15345 [Planctomycetota bacterium]
MPAWRWKPHVENRVKLMQRRQATPVPQMQNLAELNEHLRRCCEAEQTRTAANNGRTIGGCSKKNALVACPCRTTVRSLRAAIGRRRQVSTVAFDKNRFSVPLLCLPVGNGQGLHRSRRDRLRQ